MRRLLAVLLLAVGLVAAPAGPAGAVTTEIWGVNFDHWWHLTTGGKETYTVPSSQQWSAGTCTNGECPYITFQTDCNLVERWPSGRVIWASNTAGILAPCTLEFQTDGNVVIYNANHTARWATGQTWGGTHSATLALYSGGCLEEWQSFNVIKWRNISGCDAY